MVAAHGYTLAISIAMARDSATEFRFSCLSSSLRMGKVMLLKNRRLVERNMWKYPATGAPGVKTAEPCSSEKYNFPIKRYVIFVIVLFF